MNWATHKKDVAFSIKLMNKGQSIGKALKATLSATRNTATVLKNESVFGNIGINETASGQNPFAFKVDVDIIEIERFKLTVRDQNKNEWTEFIEIPLKKDLPELKDFQIAAGKIFTVAKGGTNM